MVSPAVKREAATWLMTDFGVSQRRACRTLELSLGTCRYESRRQEGGVIRERILALAEQRPRFGYRRIWVLLRREGHRVNAKRVYRLYRLERLKLRTKKRKRVSRDPGTPLLEPNNE
jgi:putative transposase